MNSKSISPGYLILTGMIFIAAFVRLIPHPPNFAPVAAMALFGGAYFSKRWAAFLVPLIAMLVTDLILGFHSTMWAVYISFVLIVGIGRYNSQRREKNGSGRDGIGGIGDFKWRDVDNLVVFGDD